MMIKEDLLKINGIDQMTYQIIKHQIWQVLWEGRSTMEKISGSVVVTEAKEVLCGLYDVNGETISSSAGLLLHILGIGNMINTIKEWYGESPGINEGDVFIINDPYIGGSHTADQACVKPIFNNGEIGNWVGTLFHTADVGAIEPGGGINPSAKEIFHEGIRFPGLKVVEKGVESKMFYKLLERSVRDPLGGILDTRAKVGALNVVEEKLKSLIDKYSLKTLQIIYKQMVIDTEVYARNKLLKYPDGEWVAETFCDHDGLEYQKIKLKLKLIKKKDQLTFDLSECSPQVHGCFNMGSQIVHGYVFTSLCTLLLYEEHWNHGIAKIFSVKYPEYPSVISVQWPGAVSGSVMLGMSLFCLADTCISMMQQTNPVYRIDQNASWNTNVLYVGWGGKNQNGHFLSTVLFDMLALGQGAGPSYDGVDTGNFRYTPEVIASDVEMNESIMPFLYMFKRQATDSSGAGKQRGGAGLEIAYKVHNTPGVVVTPCGKGKKTIAGPGLWGGHGAPPAEQYFGISTNLPDWIKQNGRLPENLQELRTLEGNIYDVPPNVPATPMNNGDFVYIYGGGGGGYGDPLDRDPGHVLEDIKKQVITNEYAENIYGVVLNPKLKGVLRGSIVETIKLDQEATKEKRRELIEGRKRKSQ